MHPISAKRHPERAATRVRAPQGAVAGAKGGRLCWLEDGQPKFWTDRPLKFAGAMRVRVEWMRKHKPEVVIVDIKWQPLGSELYYRLPDFPDGLA